MNALRAKQAMKLALFRAVGEASAAFGARTPATSLRVLMYHKVDDVPDNPTTVPRAVFEAQLERVRELGGTFVGLDAVRDHYVGATPLPQNAVLVTFDDGYRDVYDNALPVLERHDAPAVVFVSVSHVETREPLPHELKLLARGIRNETLDWGLVRELDAAAMRVESHGLRHEQLTSLALDAAAREIALSKLVLEERLEREVHAYAYVKGTRAAFNGTHESIVQQAGYDLAFTTLAHANRPDANRFRLGRYTAEPFPRRTFDLVLAGACDAMAVKDSVAGTHAKRVLNRVLGTATT